MAIGTAEAQTERIESVVALAREKLREDAAPRIEEFVRRYYAGVAPEDLLAHTTEDANGGVHTMTFVRPSGVVGIGGTTGKTYRGTGGTYQHENEDADGFPSTYSYSNIFRIIGQGPGNNMILKE